MKRRRANVNGDKLEPPVYDNSIGVSQLCKHRVFVLPNIKQKRYFNAIHNR